MTLLECLEKKARNFGADSPRKFKDKYKCRYDASNFLWLKAKASNFIYADSPIILLRFWPLQYGHNVAMCFGEAHIPTKTSSRNFSLFGLWMKTWCQFSSPVSKDFLRWSFLIWGASLISTRGRHRTRFFYLVFTSAFYVAWLSSTRDRKSVV